MRLAPLSLLVLTALIGTPSLAAFADPAPAASRTAARSSTSDADQYAAREAKDTVVTNFKGGGEVLVIGGSALTLVLVVLLVVILL
jgi:hypothetical protein